MANTSVTYDWGKMGEAASALETQLGLFNDAVEKIFSEVSLMGLAWTGPSYEAFNKYCTEYRTKTINPLAEDISKWVNNIKTLSEQAAATSSSNAGLFGGN